jgi:toxin-antitoxin system PIN domain toxin
LPKAGVHLLDINIVLALLDQRHPHHAAAEGWFDSPGLRWSLCPFTEAGVLRFFTRPKTGGLSMKQATAMIERLKLRPGYSFQPITAEWQELTKPFAKRIHGHNQVTDAYLLGLALREDLVLTSFDRALQHLAGEHTSNLLILAEN